MAKIETTLPTVAFGNVKVTFTPEELGVDISDAAAIGVATAVYLNLFTQGFKTGAQMDVSAPVSAPQGVTEAQAQRMLDEGLGGVTEISDEEFEQKARAAEAEMSGKAPWDKPAAEVKKPWETESLPPEAVVTSPAVLDAAW